MNTAPRAPRRAHTLLLSGLATLLAGSMLAAAPAAPAAAADTPQHARTAGTAAKAGKTQVLQHRLPRLTRGQKVMRVARAQAGDAYRYGAAGPSAFDCSGFTQFVYRRAVGERLPHSSAAQVGRTNRISRAAARPGDLVFFHDGGGVYHVGVYAGDNHVWHAPRPGERVHRARIWTGSVFFGRVR